MRNIRRFLRACAIVTVLSGSIVSYAGAWSSQNDETAKGLLGTHQFMCKAAHVRFIDHPAAEFYGFPGIEAILFYSGVNLKQEGEGPDNSGQSTYADHWYNPLTKLGNTPEVTEGFSKNLVKDLKELSCVDESDAVQRTKLRNQAARDAAYSAHYIQDMTCPFHLVGMPKDQVTDQKQDVRITGPFRVFDDALWARSLKESNKDTDKGNNWFDPTYFDGIDLSPSKLSSHVLYEAMVELNYYLRNMPVNRGLLWNALRTDHAQKFWKNGLAVRDYVHAIAADVRQRLDRKDPSIYFDAEALQGQFRKAEQKFTGVLTSELLMLAGKRDLFFVPKMYDAFLESLTAVMQDVPRPSREWAQAIQANYVIWRAAFSATAIKKHNIVFVKVPHEPGLYRVKVKVSNLEPEEAATNVAVTYKVRNNGQETSADNPGRVASIPAVDVPNIISRWWNGDGSQEDQDTDNPRTARQNVPSSDSDWVEIPGAVRIDGDFRKTEAIIGFGVKAAYSAVPDSGLSVVQYKVKELKTDAICLPDMRKTPRDKALNALGVLSTEFQISEQMAEAAPSSNLDHCIKDQKPEPGTWVSSKDAIQLWTYNTYSTVTLKGRVISDGVRIKPVAGAIIAITVGQYRGTVTSDAKGHFELQMTVTPDVVNHGLPFTVQVQQPGFFPFQEQMSLTEDTWVIRLKPNVEPVIAMRMGRVKLQDEMIGAFPQSGWVYEVFFTVRNASVHFTSMDTQENTQNGSLQDESCNVYLQPGPERSFVFRTSKISVYNHGDINKLQQKVTLKGTDENGIPRMYTFLFDAARHAAVQQQNTDQFNLNDLMPRYLEAYNNANYGMESFESLGPIEAAYRGQDHLVFVKKLMEKKLSKLVVDDFKKLNRDEFTKMCYLVQYYIYKTIVTGDSRHEQKAQYILQALAPGKRMFVGLVMAWPSEQVGRRATELAPEFFGN